MQNRLDILVRCFEQSYPGIAKEAVTFELSGDNSIVAELSGGSKLEYHSRLNTIMFITDGYLEVDDETSWRNRFQYLLNKKMSDECVDITILSEKTGIALKTLYNYLNKKTTPSCWNVKKIAEALGCDVEELM